MNQVLKQYADMRRMMKQYGSMARMKMRGVGKLAGLKGLKGREACQSSSTTRSNSDSFDRDGQETTALEKARRLAELVSKLGGYRWVGIYDVGVEKVNIIAWSGFEAPAHPSLSP